jgi:hypothetical protein
MAQKAGRSVAEKIENLLWKGSTELGSNNTVFGYTTAPNKNTYAGADWSLTATTGDKMIRDTLAMIAALQADHMYGPYVMYISIPAMTNLGNDFKANSDRTILERLLAIDGISSIRSTANLADTDRILVQMTSDVVQMIDGIQPTMIQWDSHGGMMTNFKVIAIMLPRFRNDSEGQSGICYSVGTGFA